MSGLGLLLATHRHTVHNANFFNLGFQPLHNFLHPDNTIHTSSLQNEVLITLLALSPVLQL